MVKKNFREKVLLKEENENIKLKKIYMHVDRNKYLIIKKVIKRLAMKYKINFYDLNELLSNKNFEKEWFFVSRFHINDNCNEKIAAIIKKKIKI